MRIMNHFGNILILLSFPLLSLNAQVDSLLFALKNHTGNDSTKVKTLWNLAKKYAPTNLDSAIYYTTKSVEVSKKLGGKFEVISLKNLGYRYYQKENIKEADKYLTAATEKLETVKYFKGADAPSALLAIVKNAQGLFNQSLIYHQKCLDLRRKAKNKKHEAIALYNMGNLFGDMKDYQKSEQYLLEAKVIFDSLGLKINLCSTLNSLGVTYKDWDNLVKATQYFEKSLFLADSLDLIEDKAIALNNIGLVYFEKELPSEAIKYFEQAFNIYEDTENYGGMADAYGDIGKASNLMKNYKYAISNCGKAFKINEEDSYLPGLIYDAECLYIAYKGTGQHSKALFYHEKLKQLQDSMFSAKKTAEITKTELNYQFDKKQLKDSLDFAVAQAVKDEQISRQKSRNVFLSLFLLAALAGVGIFFFQFKQTQKARRRSDELLLNILPAKTAQELKEKGKAAARKFDHATVLFTDFKNFTKMAEVLSADQLVGVLDDLFRGFDESTHKYGLEKIKTIGDAYFAVGGVPEDNETPTENVILAALEMLEFLKNYNNPIFKNNNLSRIEMRVGIHSGAVVAGVVGKKKFQYDIWGNTVNTAARMESSGEIGKVNISKTTYELVKENPDFQFIERGKIAAKNKGEMEMFFVEKAG